MIKRLRLVLFFLLCGSPLTTGVFALDYDIDLKLNFGKKFVNDLDKYWERLYTTSSTIGQKNIYIQSTGNQFPSGATLNLMISPIFGHYFGIQTQFISDISQATVKYKNTITDVNTTQYSNFFFLLPGISYKFYPLATEKNLNFYIGTDIGYALSSSWKVSIKGNNNLELTFDRIQGFSGAIRAGYKFAKFWGVSAFVEVAFQTMYLSSFNDASSGSSKYDLKISNDTVTANGNGALALIQQGSTDFAGYNFDTFETWYNQVQIVLGINYQITNK